MGDAVGIGIQPELEPQRQGADREFAAMQAQMRDWRSRDVEVPPAGPDTSPLGRVLGTDTPEGAAKFARGKAYREAGYDGPLDNENRIPDPDDPAEYEALHALAAMRVMTTWVSSAWRSAGSKLLISDS